MSQSLFGVMEAVDFFEKQGNDRGKGSCFMVLGCIYAS